MVAEPRWIDDSEAPRARRPRLDIGSLTAVVGAVVAGALVRVLPATGGFPVNDGGMFTVMIEDLKAANFALPAFTTYNGADIPFAYPPLGFYLGALVSMLPGFDVLRALVWLPVVTSIATLAAFYPLARRFLGVHEAALLATFALAFTPRAYNWEIMGGGLTRSLGMFLAVLALTFLYDVYVRGSRRAIVPAAVLASLAILSHLEMGWFTVYSSGLFLAFHRERFREKVIATGVIGLIVTAVTAPWWLAMLTEHGPGPLLAAMQTGDWSPLTVVRMLMFDFGEAPLLDLIPVLAAVGVFAAAGKGTWLLPAWVLLIFLLDPRKAPTLATFPIALLAGIGLYEVLLPALRRTAERIELVPASGSGRGARIESAFVLTLLVYSLASAAASGWTRTVFTWSPTSTLPAEERAAMEWIANETPEDSRFIVVTDSFRWAEDRTAEWFPALAERPSVATPQGYEWLSELPFASVEERYEELARCGHQSVSCLTEWSEAHSVAFTHVYLAGSSHRGVDEDTPPTQQRLAACCDVLAASLAAASDYRLLRDEGDVLIYEYLGRTAAASK